MLLAQRLHIRILAIVCSSVASPTHLHKPFFRFVFRARILAFLNKEWNWRPPNLLNATSPSLKVVVLRRPKWDLRPKAFPPAGWHQLN